MRWSLASRKRRAATSSSKPNRTSRSAWTARCGSHSLRGTCRPWAVQELQGRVDSVAKGNRVLAHQVDGKMHYTHRAIGVAFGLLNGMDDPRQIDHIDNPSNNCLSTSVR